MSSLSVRERTLINRKSNPIEYVYALDRIVSDTQVTNTLAVSTLYEFDIENLRFNGASVQLDLGGVYYNQTGLTRTITFLISFGTDLIYEQSVDIADWASERAFNLKLNLVSRSSASQTLNGLISINGDSMASTGIGGLDAVNAASTPIYGSSTQTTNNRKLTNLLIQVQHNFKSTDLYITAKTGSLIRV